MRHTRVHHQRRVPIGVLAMLIASVALSGTFLSVADAAAKSGRAPTLRISGYGVTQAGWFAGSSGSDSPGPRCAVLIADGGGPPPGPFLVDPGRHRGRIRLHTSTRPTHVRLSEQTKTLNGYPTGRPVPLRSTLVRRTTSGGASGWVLRFHVSIPPTRNIWLDLTVENRRSRCDFDNTEYLYHLRGSPRAL
jgi:hypothetical protein